ncbi:MinD/ParA family ATP-binding protein [Mycobacterium asiaticum]|uniref:CobQ/CobB/MinD/ParA nucleotide binding domain-containing protein n=1 Tax=Mycobacterium asiaticum TaxID=1790 RepID=A0A1A3L1F0_MYCAS|nr:MinD/ParA family protein [Mycobacterium asiaticum]OBJ91075.1 hypothetical protein A5640_00020 [Mycobacterium asiaticum]
MTDDSDFRSRYLAPAPGGRYEPAAPAPAYREDFAMPEPHMSEPTADTPAPAQSGPHQHTDAPGPSQLADPPVQKPAPAQPMAAPRTPTPAAADLAPASSPVRAWAPPPPRAGNGVREAAPERPAPIPAPPRLAERAVLAPPPQWTPPVDPAQRWAPRADPQAPTASPLRHIQIDEVVKERREPATMGWRKAVYVATGKVVNLGAGPHERNLREWTARIKSNIPGNYQIAAVSVKGGVGKTRVTAGVGTVFAKVRGGHVIAVDADATYGGLGRFVDRTMTTTVREFLADPDALTHPKTRLYTGINDQGLEVLGGHQNVASEFTLDQHSFFDTISRTRSVYQLCLVDCAEIEGDLFKAVLSSSDALMIVGSCTAEGGLALEKTVDWLAARRGHELLNRSVIVLNDAHRSASSRFITHVKETVGTRVRTVKTIPWDPHLRDAATLDYAALRKNTQLAFLDLAAEMATGFPTAGALAG